jgi:hypothetical protein
MLSGCESKETTSEVTCQRTEVRGQRSADPGAEELEDGDQSVGVCCKKDDERGDEDQRPAFEFGDSSVGFAGLGVDFFEFFVDAVEALLAAVRQRAAAY